MSETRETRLTRARRLAFLARLAVDGSPSAAAKVAGIGRATAYRWRIADPEFGAAWDEITEAITDGLEAEAIRRAQEGTEEVVGVTRDGDAITTVKRSDRLMEFLLRGRRRHLYGEPKGSVTVTMTAEQLRGMSDAELEQLVAKLG